MIIIDEKYYINADNKNYILQEKGIVKNEDSKNFGKEVFKDLGYFNSLDSVYHYVVNLKIKQYISKDKINTLEQLTNKIKRIEKDITNQFNMSKRS